MRMSAMLPGFLAIAPAGPGESPPARDDTLVADCGPAKLRFWGIEPIADGPAFIASRVARRAGGRLADAEVVSLLRTTPSALASLLPPFAAVLGGDDGVRVATDSMGFQHVFSSEGEPSVLSTSSMLAGRAIGAGFDETALAVQSLMGWQLGQRTLFRGVLKLRPGAVATLSSSGVKIDPIARVDDRPIDARAAVVEAAGLLRESLNALLDDHPDAVLQLTGGMDSRLLLSAIPITRRRGLRAMTLEVPGKGDVAIACQIASRYGIHHEVRGLSDLRHVSPNEAWVLCRDEATRLDGMSDPVALAAQRIAERAFDQGVRISGLGGEVARGFYYVGRVADRGYTRSDAARLAAWRMFVNEAVEPGLMTEDFSGWARDVATDEVFAALRQDGSEWFRATDGLYLHHRMQRWAGATDTAVSNERVVVNPMLDRRFIEIAGRLAPRDKVDSRFLGALQMELDPELGRMPLDGRPAPDRFARPSRLQPVTTGLSTAKRIARKAGQRLRRGNRPPAGGSVMAAKVVEHWRSRPEVLDPLRNVPGVQQDWVSAVLDGSLEPRPSSVAFVTNLVVAGGTDD